MIRFFVDKKNKVPLYLQLMDEIKFYISTGVLGENEQLPPVKVLAKTLGINFLTVRKAYKELETAGLLDVRQGDGTFISLTTKRTTAANNFRRKGAASNGDVREKFAVAASSLFEQYVGQGLEIADAREIADAVLAEVENKRRLPRVVFAECNRFQVEEISSILTKELKIDVEPILIQELPRRLPRWLEDGRAINIITTGFHTDRVRKAVGDMPVEIDVLITNLDPETRRKIEAIGENASYAFICRDKESAAVYKDLLPGDLGYKNARFVTCTIAENERLSHVIDASDVILVSPLVWEEVRAICPPTKPMFNVFDRVDPMSLKVVRDRILGYRKF